MPNTNLPTNITKDYPGYPAMLNTAHAEINELSRNTGRRDITSYLINGWTAPTSTSRVLIEGVRDEINLYTRGISGENATSMYFLRFADLAANPGAPFIGLGFRPYGTSYQSAVMADDDGGFWQIRADGNYIWMPPLNGRDYKRFHGGYWRKFSWKRDPSQPFPNLANLPGVAA